MKKCDEKDNKFGLYCTVEYADEPCSNKKPQYSGRDFWSPENLVKRATSFLNADKNILDTYSETYYVNDKCYCKDKNELKTSGKTGSDKRLL